MLTRTVRKTGDTLPILGFGCMRMPERNGRIDEERAERLIRSAVDKGVTYLDTAFPYHMGAAEPFLGKIMDAALRKRVKIATKLPPASVRTREDMDAVLNNQLARLKTDRIDYYLLHGIEEKSWAKFQALGALDFLDKARKDGRILNAGFSFHGGGDSFKGIVDAYDWQVCQIQYNYFDRDFQAGADGLAYAAGKGLGVMIMEPLRGGLLVNSVPREVSGIWGKAQKRRTPAEWALRWIWNHPEVTTVLSGMNAEAQLEENVRIASDAVPGHLTPRELEIVEEARTAYRRLLKIGCTGCRYCVPCPKGVEIPLCFDYYNRVVSFREAKLLNQQGYMLLLGGINTGKNAAASLCTRCGACEKKCPQHLPIRDHLEDVKKVFETPFYKIMSFFSRFFFTRIR